MMNKMRLFLLAGMASFLMAGCVVGPHIAHIPIYEQQGDMQVSGSLSVWDGASASAGVAMTDHIAMQTTASVQPVNNIINTQTSLGYYLPFENHTMLGIYGGFGTGNGKEHVVLAGPDGRQSSVIDEYDNRYFLQVDYGWMRSDCWGITGRISTGYMQREGCFFVEPALDIPSLTGPLRFDIKFSCIMLINGSDIFPIPNAGLGVSYRFNVNKERTKQ